MRRGTLLVLSGLLGCCWGGLAGADQGTAPDTRQASEARIAELERAVGRLSLELEAAKKASTLLGSRRGTSGR